MRRKKEGKKQCIPRKVCSLTENFIGGLAKPFHFAEHFFLGQRMDEKEQGYIT